MGSDVLNRPAYGRLAPQLWQKLPLQVAPQAQVQVSDAGRLAPQLWQKLPAAVAPQAQVQLSAAAG